MKHDKNGKPTFVDKQDKATFELLLSSFKDRDEIFVMTISQHKKRTNSNQIVLWNTLVSLISTETGNDIKTIEETLMNNFSKNNEKVETLSNERFQELLMFATSFSLEFLELNIVLENDKFQIKKI